MKNYELLNFLSRVNSFDVVIKDIYKLAPLGRALLKHKINSPNKFPVEEMITYLKITIDNHPLRWRMIQDQCKYIDALLDGLRILDKNQTEGEILWASLKTPEFLPQSYFARIKLKLIEEPHTLDPQTGVNLMGRFILDYCERSFYLLDRITELKKYILISLEDPESIFNGFWELVGVINHSSKLLKSLPLKDNDTVGLKDFLKTLSEKVENFELMQKDFQANMFKELEKLVNYNDDSSGFEILDDNGFIQKENGKYVVYESLPQILNYWDKYGINYNFHKIKQNFVQAKTRKPFSDSYIHNNLNPKKRYEKGRK